jgi:predicted carbohydrate-binding protein with CBM5 and CBM33 domain
MTKESWKEGQPLTAEDARTIAQTLLEHAEVDNEESESHRVTRDFRTA